MRYILMPARVVRRNTMAWLGAALLVPPLTFWVVLAIYLTGWPWGGELIFRSVPESLQVALLLALPAVAAVIGGLARRGKVPGRARTLGTIVFAGGVTLTLVAIAAGMRPS